MGLQEAQMSQAFVACPTHPPASLSDLSAASCLPALSFACASLSFLRSLPPHSLICSLILSNDPSPQLGHLRPETGLQLQEARVKDGSHTQLFES